MNNAILFLPHKWYDEYYIIRRIKDSNGLNRRQLGFNGVQWWCATSWFCLHSNGIDAFLSKHIWVFMEFSGNGECWFGGRWRWGMRIEELEGGENGNRDGSWDGDKNGDKDGDRDGDRKR